MVDDIRYAFRLLRKQPGFALVAVATLGLGIGAAAAMFGLIQGALLSPPPYTDPDRLVLVSPVRVDGQPYERGTSIGEWVAWRQARTVEPPAMYRWTFNFLVRDTGSESLGGMVVTRNYFRVLGVEPMLGRTFAESETARPNVAPTAIILGYDLWQRAFGGDPAIVGKTARISRMPAPLPIVGVMPPGVRFLPDPGAASEPNYDLHAKVDFWLGFTPDESRPDARGGNAIARLRDGAAIGEAQAELATVFAALNRSDPALRGLTASVSAVRDVLNRDGRRLLVPLFGAVGLLFLIACANVTGLLVARGLRRQQEYSTRSALGAGRGRLFRLVLTESLALALAGSLVGAGLAFGIVTLLKAIGGRAVPRADAVSVGWPVLVFGCLAALVAAIVAGLLPALRASLPDRYQGLKGSRSSAGRAERRLLASVATLQMVLTVSLLAGAALLVRTAHNLDRVRPGYDTERILAMTVTTVQRERWKAFHTQALEQVARVPGVARTAFAWGVPLTGNKWPVDIEIPGAPGSWALVDRISLPARAVTPDYFEALGIALVEGRGFRPGDDGEAARVAIVNGAFVRQHFGAGHPLGRQIRFVGADRFIEIVGVIADTRTEGLHRAPAPELYLPLWQSNAFSKHLVVRATGDPLLLAPRVRDALRAIDPTSAVEHVTTLAEIRRESTASEIFALRLLGGFALVATLLASVGLYGVLSLSVGARTKEIAVRKALGAQRHQVVGLVVREGAGMIAVGVGVGILGALLVGRLVERLLFDVTATDPLSLASAAVAFGGVALAACLVPAWRAGRVDLMESLRQE